MEFFIIWLVLPLIIGVLGKNRSIEFSGAFCLSLILSPLVGLMLVLLSPKTTDAAARALMEGEKFLRRGNYSKAISAFHSTLQTRPHSTTAHFNLARAYSLNNMPEKSLYHLNKAFENGYFNLHRLYQSPDLQNLRSYKGFKSFEPNRFMLGYYLSESKQQHLLNAS